MVVARFRMWRIEPDKPRLEERHDEVVVELPLEIRVNGRSLAVLMRTPGMDEELAVGFCLTEGVIGDSSQIRVLRSYSRQERKAGRDAIFNATLDEVDVVEVDAETMEPPCRLAGRLRVKTSCGGKGSDFGEAVEEGRVDSELVVDASILYGLARKLREGQSLFPRTGGAHGAAVFEADGEPLIVVEDVGRHNALDKAVGWCAMKRVSLKDKILFISGRISFEMVLKTARAGVPVLASVAAPTSLGVALAEKAGLTLVGFCGERRCNLYTHPWRIR